MGRFDLNSARSYVGHSVNLHLKDGSVIINVLVTNVQRNNRGKSAALCYTTPTKRIVKIGLREIEWAERLDSYLFMALTRYRKRRARRRIVNPS